MSSNARSLPASYGLRTPDTAKIAKAMEEGEGRIHVRVPEALHRRVKVRCAERGISLRDYVLQLLEKDGLS
jgi:predicted DNA binding CopG/RHH family protein